MTDHNYETLTARLVDLDAQIEELQAQRKATAQAIIDGIEVGGAASINGQTYYRVQQKRTFDVDKAKEIVPAELIAAASFPTLDVKTLKSLMPPALVDVCMTPGAIFVAKASK